MEKKSKEWREKNKLTEEEITALIDNVNENMKRYDADIQFRMKMSDETELKYMTVRPEDGIGERY